MRLAIISQVVRTEGVLTPQRSRSLSAESAPLIDGSEVCTAGQIVLKFPHESNGAWCPSTQELLTDAINSALSVIDFVHSRQGVEI